MEISEHRFELLESTQENYYELIMAVENKYPNETRHQTALRFIREAQQPHNKAVESDRANLGGMAQPRHGESTACHYLCPNMPGGSL